MTNFLKAIAYLTTKNSYLCIEMSGKGSISRMSDECRKDGRRKMLLHPIL